VQQALLAFFFYCRGINHNTPGLDAVMTISDREMPQMSIACFFIGIILHIHNIFQEAVVKKAASNAFFHQLFGNSGALTLNSL